MIDVQDNQKPLTETRQLNCIMFTFVSDKNNLDRLTSIMRKNKLHLSGVVNMSNNWSLATRMPCESKHITEYMLETANEYRAVANDWLMKLADVRLEDGTRLIEALVYNDIAIWWFVELGLQEKSFLVLRFIKTLNYILDKFNVNAFVIAGDDSTTWTRALLKKICESRNMSYYDLESYVIIKKPTKSEKEIKILWKVITKREAAAKRSILIISSILLLLTSVMLSIAHRRPKKIKSKIKRYWFRRFLHGVLLIGVVLQIAKTLPLDLPIKNLVISILPRANLISANLAKSYEGQMIFTFKKLSNSVRRSIRKLMLIRKKIERKVPKDGDILVVCESAGIKHGRSLVDYEKSIYHPYIENISDSLEKIERKEGLNTTYAYYGGGFLETNHISPNNAWIHFSEFMNQEHVDASERFKEKVRNFTNRLKNDTNLIASLSYQNIKLDDVLLDDLLDRYVASSDSILYMEVFSEILKKLRPSVVVMNNYEGVFRMVVAACVLANVPVIGIQQALGPYVHSLNKLQHGIRNQKLKNKFGFPVPDKIVVWGDAHKENFCNYGFNYDMIKVTGYCRLDTFVNNKQSINKVHIKKKLGLPKNSKVIMFVGTYCPRGFIETLEDKFVRTILELRKITEKFSNAYVLVKPWAGDELDSIKEFVRNYGNDKFMFVDPNTEIHNVELLAITDVILGSQSSIFAEAIAMECYPIYMNYLEEKAYQEDGVKLIEKFAQNIGAPEETYDAVSDALVANKKGLPNEEFNKIFGLLDGRSSERIANEIVELAKMSIAVHQN